MLKIATFEGFRILSILSSGVYRVLKMAQVFEGGSEYLGWCFLHGKFPWDYLQPLFVSKAGY